MYSIIGLRPNFITTCNSGLYVMGGVKKETLVFLPLIIALYPYHNLTQPFSNTPKRRAFLCGKASLWRFPKSFLKQVFSPINKNNSLKTN